MRKIGLAGAFLLALALALAGCGSAAATLPSVSQVASTSFGSLVVTTRIPENMRVGESYIVRVTLAPHGGYSTLSDIPDERSSAITSSATPVGTPSVALRNAFGSGYEPYAHAQLAGGSFTLQMVSQDVQSLRQPTVTWEWNITPLFSGAQLIDAAITVEWVPTSAGSHSLPLNPSYTIATVDTPVTVLTAAPMGTPTPGSNVIHVGPLPIDTTSLTTDILASVLAALAVSAIGFTVVKVRGWRPKVSSTKTRE